VLSFNSANLYLSLPDKFKYQLTIERDENGNIELSQIEIEKFIAEAVRTELQRRKKIELRNTAKDEEELLKLVKNETSFF